MSDYRITIRKTCSRLTFELRGPDGETLIAERPLVTSSSIGVDFVDNDARFAATSDTRPWLNDVCEMGLDVLRFNDGKHVQFMQDGKVLADWWPGKGTTMMDGKRGPACMRGEDVIAWLKTV